MNYDKIANALYSLMIDKKLSQSETIIESRKVAGAIQAFFNPKGTLEKYKRSIQATNNASFGTSTDLAQIGKDAHNFIMDMDGINDNGWEAAFKKVTSGENGGWEIHTGKSGLKLIKRAEGEKLEVRSVSSEKDTIYVEKYGEALGITDEMIRFRKIAAMMDLFEEAKEAYLIGKSAIFYNLITTAAATNTTTYDSVTADGQLQRDIKTINSAANSIGDRMKTKISNAASVPLLMYANPNDEARIEAVFVALTNNLATAGKIGQQVTGRQIRRIYTYNVDAYYPVLGVAGRKNQWAEALPLTQFSQTDILIFSYIQAYWTYFGGTVADTDQWQKVSLK